MYRSSGSRRLLYSGIMGLTAIALLYDYVTTEGLSGAFLGIIGVGLLLALVVIVPALVFNDGVDSDR
jgi:hypothetical protein